MFLQDLFLQTLQYSLQPWLLYRQQYPQTPTSALAAALAPSSGLRTDTYLRPVSISHRRRFHA